VKSSDRTESAGGRIRSAVRDLSPGYFALVMATGIVSVGLQLEGMTVASVVLLVVAAVAYVVLVVLSVWRIVGASAAVAVDFADPVVAFQFFTFVAATGVLGARIVLIPGEQFAIGLPTVLLFVASVGWVVLGYAIPWAVVIGRQSRPVLSGVDGTWFVWAVASQSVAVLAALLEPLLPDARELLSVLAVLCWGVGGILYCIIGMAAVVRLLVHGITPQQLGPSYWVAMGASAITVLAGSRIVDMTQTPMVHATRGLAAGVSAVFWMFATWLIPVLVAIGWWRHVRHRIPLRYEPSLWNIVFPLGMYAVCSIYLGQADSLPLVGAIGSAFLWVAVAAWLATAVAMALHIGARLFGRVRLVP
jgi:tellurite resistance protein TehA-like permease